MDNITAMRKEYIAYQAGDETRGGSINTRAAGEGGGGGGGGGGNRLIRELQGRGRLAGQIRKARHLRA